MPSGYRFAVILLVLHISFACVVTAQNSIWNSSKKTIGKVDKEKGKLKKWKEHLQQWGLDTGYKQQIGVGGKLNTNGWSGVVYYQKRINNTQDYFFFLSFSEIQHEKQIKQQGLNKNFPQLGSTTPFVFGKINNLYTLQIGHGRKILLLPGVFEGNISVSMCLLAGFSLAMLKPYYLKLIYADFANNSAYLQEEKYSHQNKDKFLNQPDILGASKWNKGLNEITYVPGGYAESAIALEPLKGKFFVQSITVGAQLAIYTKSLPIIAERKAYPYQGSLYVGLAFAKKWK